MKTLQLDSTDCTAARQCLRSKKQKRTDQINEQAVLTYKIQNDSQYNAQLGEMNCTSDDTDYVQITRGGALTNTIIEKGQTSDADTITVKLVKTYSETTPKRVTITCDLNATAQSAA